MMMREEEVGQSGVGDDERGRISIVEWRIMMEEGVGQSGVNDGETDLLISPFI
jgi:hypothetical protein